MMENFIKINQLVIKISPLYLKVYLIDECATATHNCSADAVCNNTKGLYNCTCKPGHFGDGRTCQGKSYSFIYLFFLF